MPLGRQRIAADASLLFRDVGAAGVNRHRDGKQEQVVARRAGTGDLVEHVVAAGV